MTRAQMTDEQIEEKFLKKKPGRTPVTGEKPAALPELLPAVEANIVAGQELALATQKAVSALASHLNYTGSTDPDVLENSARDAIRRIGAGIFELGGYLLLLKEACGHGKFLPALERLAVEPRAAQRYMDISRRFANTSTSTHLQKAGLSKLVELLPLDDAQVTELTELGQTGDLALDDVARMSVKELRAAVHKARAESAKQQRRAERQEAVAAELHEEIRAVRLLPPDEELKRVQAAASNALAETLGMVQGSLRQALIALNNRGDNTVFMAGLVGQVVAELAALREEFNLPDVSEAGQSVEPEAQQAIRDALQSRRANAAAL